MKDKILKEFDEKFNVNKHIDKGNFGGGWRTIPFGTKVIINGQTYSVEDRTAQWVQDEKGFTIDIFMEEGCDANFGADKKLIIIK